LEVHANVIKWQAASPAVLLAAAMLALAYYSTRLVQTLTLIQTLTQHRSLQDNDMQEESHPCVPSVGGFVHTPKLPFAFHDLAVAFPQANRQQVSLLMLSSQCYSAGSGVGVEQCHQAEASQRGLLQTQTVKQLWTVKHSGDTIEIDLGGAVIKSTDPVFLRELCRDGKRAFNLNALGSAGQATNILLLCHAFTGFCNVHIFNGRIEFGAGFAPLTTSQPHSTVRLTSVKLTATSDAKEDVSKPGSLQSFLVISTQPQSSFILEDCVFEATFDSPAMYGLTACAASFGGQVGLCRTAVIAHTCNALVQQWPACPCHLLHRQALNCLACFTCCVAPADHDDQMQVSWVQAGCASRTSEQGGSEGLPGGLDREGCLRR
jgi:hypothetical protein